MGEGCGGGGRTRCSGFIESMRAADFRAVALSLLSGTAVRHRVLHARCMAQGCGGHTGGGPGYGGPDYGLRFAPAAAQHKRGNVEPVCDVLTTTAKGMGVFAGEEIERGRWVCQYIGTLVTDSDDSGDASSEQQWDPLGIMPTPESTSGLPRVDKGSDYNLALCPGLCLDARHSDHFSRFINHDEHGNLRCAVSVEERRADFFAAVPIQCGSGVKRPLVNALARLLRSQGAQGRLCASRPTQRERPGV